MIKKIAQLFILTLTIAPLLWSCTGIDDTTNSCNMKLPIISSNSPVSAGRNIMLETPYYSSMAEYHWTGPNGFTSSLQNPVVVASDLTAGKYSLVINEYNCATKAVNKTIVVTPAIATCSPANNTASNSVYTPMSYYYVSEGVVQDTYQIIANGSNGDMYIKFANDATPIAGVYSISSSYYDVQSTQVGVSLVTLGTFFTANFGDVYISYINGHMSATFCNVAFSGGSLNFTSSAKITDQ